jgi:hypothetical protein
MRFDQSTNQVFIRQSWLNDLIICPERSRFKLEKPQMSGASDATIMGTAVHAGIESYLRGEIPIERIPTVALLAWKELCEQPFKTTNLNIADAPMQITSMCQAWIDKIAPKVQLGGQVEHKFSFPLNMTVGDWSVWCEGTMDYVQPDGIIWDWKTASRSYYAKEKQSQAIQPTVYAAALHYERQMDYPIEFRYGIMIRQETPKAQIVYIHRTEAHERWLMHNIKPALIMAIRMGTNNSWVMNDTTALCSDKWCDYWSLCKGAFLSPSDLSLPMQTGTITSVDIRSTDE